MHILPFFFQLKPKNFQSLPETKNLILAGRMAQVVVPAKQAQDP
jgi:hypothetical protein